MTHAAPVVDVFDRLEFKLDAIESLRYLGYPAGAPVHAEVAGRLDDAVKRANRAIRPRGTCALYEVEKLETRSLRLAGGDTFHGLIGKFLKGSERVAVFVVTAGAELNGLADACWKEGDPLGGWIYTSLGSQAAEGALSALEKKLRRHLRDGEELTIPYSPGYCGMDLAQQALLFRLVDADPIGVKLTPSLLMDPLKSISGLFGIGPKEKIARHRSPCALCKRTDCHMRR